MNASAVDPHPLLRAKIVNYMLLRPLRQIRLEALLVRLRWFLFRGRFCAFDWVSDCSLELSWMG